MAVYLTKAAVITQADPPVSTVVPAPGLLKAITVVCRKGTALVNLGPISGQSVVLVKGETLDVSTLASVDSVEVMTVTAQAPSSEALIVWSHF